MLQLYYKPTCPYCLRVLAANEAIKAPLELLDVNASLATKETLVRLGGKTQVPFLHDTDRNVMMYESTDIIAYLATHYGNGTIPATRPTGNVCPID